MGLANELACEAEFVFGLEVGGEGGEMDGILLYILKVVDVGWKVGWIWRLVGLGVGKVEIVGDVLHHIVDIIVHSFCILKL